MVTSQQQWRTIKKWIGSSKPFYLCGENNHITDKYHFRNQCVEGVIKLGHIALLGPSSNYPVVLKPLNQITKVVDKWKCTFFLQKQGLDQSLLRQPLSVDGALFQFTCSTQQCFIGNQLCLPWRQTETHWPCRKKPGRQTETLEEDRNTLTLEADRNALTLEADRNTLTLVELCQQFPLPLTTSFSSAPNAAYYTVCLSHY